MDKKEYVTTLLEGLKDDWPLARGLLILITYDKFDDLAIDSLIHIINESIKSVNEDNLRASLVKSSDLLKKIKEKEMKEDEIDLEEIGEIEDVLEGIP